MAPPRRRQKRFPQQKRAVESSEMNCISGKTLSLLPTPSPSSNTKLQGPIRTWDSWHEGHSTVVLSLLGDAHGSQRLGTATLLDSLSDEALSVSDVLSQVRGPLPKSELSKSWGQHVGLRSPRCQGTRISQTENWFSHHRSLTQRNGCPGAISPLPNYLHPPGSVFRHAPASYPVRCWA